MCGISGIFNLNGAPVNTDKLMTMAHLIKHRGPSDEGYLLWNTKEKRFLRAFGNDTIVEIKKETSPLQNTIRANLGLAFRRLSIIDLSPSGHQPMASDDKQVWIVFNGEIYNYLELRDELKTLGFQFKSNSDTEVIVNAYRAWGIDCLQKFNGMWAFCLWDARKQRLFCARDRFGIKPFYYFFDQRRFIFASEIKALLIHEIDRQLDEKAIYRSIRLNSFLINGDSTYFKQIKMLPQSHFLLLENRKLTVRRYYDLNMEKFESSQLTFAQAKEKYRQLFLDSIKLRMRSDVEVGATLSGGLDSSAIVSAAAHLTDRSFQTFSAYYTHDARYDERPYVRLLAQKHGLRDHYISVQSNEALNDFYRITYFLDYPILGSSYISQHFVMKLARQHAVTVLLDGQGSDELLGGYNHAFYRYYADLIRFGKIIKLLKELPAYLRYHQKGTIWQKLAKIGFTLLFPESFIYKEEAQRSLPNPFNADFSHGTFNAIISDLPTTKLSNFLYNLLMNSMLPTLLHFEDRNSMASSIESRVPFLDYRLVEFAFSLPGRFKIQAHKGKIIHREALRTLVPSEILERKDKVSFFSPGEFFWLRNDFRNYAYSVFHSRSFANRGIFDVKKIGALYNQYLNGHGKLGTMLWKVFALEHWFRVFFDDSFAQWQDKYQ